jgi:hypothetical protein
MTVFVFLGPTLTVREARRVLDVDYLPPVAQGDVLRAARLGPQAIAIIDGYFERVPAVWHKEILWAMSQGIHVYGAASMGALRAAELRAFGMVGVGQIYEDFVSGVLEADDEVAVAHGSASDDYRRVSDALVNIRATLAAAVRETVISEATQAVLERTAKSEFYPTRHYALLFEHGRRLNLPESELAALRGWLPRGRVDQKKIDALELLQRLDELNLSSGPRKEVRYRFEHTDAWQAALNRADEEAALSGVAAAPTRQSE